MERRHDIDWLRVIAIGLLLIYHTGIAFQPWGVFIGFIQNENSLQSIWVPMSMLNVWRIPLLFFVSGMGVRFAMRRRSWKQLLLERTRRILVPYVFGMFTLVPLHQLLFLKYYSQDLAYAHGPGHLWFLGNIFMYVLVFSPLFYLLISREEQPWVRRLKKVISHPLGWLLLPAAFAAETWLLNPESYTFFAMTTHGLVLGALAFLFGFLFVFAGEGFWKRLQRFRWILLGLALLLFLNRWLRNDLEVADPLMAVETASWVLTALALGSAYLRRPGKALSYLTKAAYPVYILHMFFLYLASYWIMPTALNPWVKLVLINLGTFGGCFLFYEFLVRRIFLLRPLFGLRLKAA